MKRCFTLIETLVAISVLALALAGPLSIAANALKSAYYARDEVTAYYLAQEGLEYVRAVRDQNYLAGNAWTTGLGDCFNVLCWVDAPRFEHQACSGQCPPLLVSATGGLYTQFEPGERSRFTRSLMIASVSANEIQVTVSVSWTSAGINRSFSLSERLLDWWI